MRPRRVRKASGKSSRSHSSLIAVASVSSTWRSSSSPLDLAHFARHEQRRVLTTLSRASTPFAPVHQRAAQRAGVEPHGHLSGKPASTQRWIALAARRRAFLRVEPFVARDAQKLLRQRGRFARGERLMPSGRQRCGLKLLCSAKRCARMSMKKSTPPVSPSSSSRSSCICLPSRAAQQIAPLRERGDERRRGHAAELVRGEQHARVARMRGKGEHAPAQRRDRAGAGIERAEIGEQRRARARASAGPAARASESRARPPRRSPSR